MEQKKSVRTSLSLIFSTLLHGSIIALIALGPTVIPGLSGKEDRRSSTIDFSVHETSTPQASVALQTTESPVAQPTPSTLADMRTVTVPTPKVKHEIKKVEKTDVTPVESEVTPEPILAAKDGEISVEDDTQPLTESVQAPVEKTVEKDFTSAAETETEAETETTAAEAVAENDSAEKNSAGEKTITVTQNYIGLKQLSGNKPPVYAREMRLQKLQGQGQLVYFVDKDGRVKNIQLTRSTGSELLDNAALNAFSKYRFVPGQDGYTIHNFEFSLKGPAELDAGRLRTRAATIR